MVNGPFNLMFMCGIRNILSSWRIIICIFFFCIYFHLIQALWNSKLCVLRHKLLWLCCVLHSHVNMCHQCADHLKSHLIERKRQVHFTLMKIQAAHVEDVVSLSLSLFHTHTLSLVLCVVYINLFILTFILLCQIFLAIIIIIAISSRERETENN